MHFQFQLIGGIQCSAAITKLNNHDGSRKIITHQCSVCGSSISRLSLLILATAGGYCLRISLWIRKTMMITCLTFLATIPSMQRHAWVLKLSQRYSDMIVYTAHWYAIMECELKEDNVVAVGDHTAFVKEDSFSSSHNSAWYELATIAIPRGWCVVSLSSGAGWKVLTESVESKNISRFLTEMTSSYVILHSRNFTDNEANVFIKLILKNWRTT